MPRNIPRFLTVFSMQTPHFTETLMAEEMYCERRKYFCRYFCETYFFFKNIGPLKKYRGE